MKLAEALPPVRSLRPRRTAGAACATFVVVVTLLAACGSSSTSSGNPAPSTNSRKTTSTAQAPTTTTISPQEFGASVCKVYTTVARRTPQPSGQARALVAQLGALKPPKPSARDLAAVVAVLREVAKVWSSAVPTTPDAFSRSALDTSARFAVAAASLRMNPCPRPTVSVTTTAPTKVPSWTFGGVARAPGEPGIYFYFAAQCPPGKTLAGVSAPWEPNTGSPNSFATLVGSLPPEAPFTPAEADRGFARKPNFNGECR